jgi:hypothetical protein
MKIRYNGFICLGRKWLLLSFPSLFLVFAFSCTKELGKDDYVNWVKDSKNGLHVTKESNGFVFEVQYQPEDYLWLQSGEQNRRTAKDRPDNIQHYLLTISPVNNELDLINSNIENTSEKQEKLYYFSYLFQNDLQIQENGKSLPCVLFHFEKPQDLKRSRTFLLGFENQSTEVKESKLVIHSEQFGSLPITIKIVKENIPTLKI